MSSRSYKTEYEHPPRTWQFWATYVGMLVVILSPTILVPIVYSLPAILAVPMLFTLISIGVILHRLWSVHHWLLNALVVYTDSDVSTLTDISEEAPAPPEELNTSVSYLEDIGFVHIGTVKTHGGLQTEPVIRWMYKDNTATIVLSITSVNGKVIANVFTYGSLGSIHTQYGRPVFEQKTSDVHIVALNTSVADAISYHTQQVIERYGGSSEPAKMRSISEWLDAWKTYSFTTDRQRTLKLILRAIGLNTLFVFAIVWIFVTFHDVAVNFAMIRLGADIDILVIAIAILPVMLWYVARWFYMRDVRYLDTSRKKK